MNTFVPAIFEQLKQLVLTQLGLKQITAADCAYVSAAIFKKTNKRVSETTLKRVYGFAYYEFNPSAFTMNLMAEYCGYTGWKDFCKHHQTPVTAPTRQETNHWASILDKAEKLTTYTLKTLKSRSGIPYDLTIERQAVNEHFALFSNSNCTATVLTAPTGYGKTTALCHWVDNYLLPGVQSRKDIVLFFSGSALVSAYNSGRELNDWLLAMMGMYNENNVLDIFNPGSNFNGRFYLIIDGLDEFNYKENQFGIIFRQLIDIITLHHEYPWFKVIVTMRSASWINNCHLINDEQHWFTGFMADNNTAVNMPLFSNEEIMELCCKLGPVRPGTLPVNVLESFSYPLYFQYYFQKRTGSFSINKFNNVSIYEIISAYVLNKIYLSKHSADSIFFLRGLLDEMNFNEGVLQVGRLQVHELLKTYTEAYKHLLQIGYLQEINTSYRGEYSHYIKFSNKKFLEFSLAKKLLNLNELCFDKKLIDSIEITTGHTDLKLPVLKWCLYHTINNNNPYDLSVLSESFLKVSEKSELIVFVSELLNRQYLLEKTAETSIDEFTNINEDILNYFVGLEFINSGYEQALQTILNFKLSVDEQIIFKCCLCIIAIYQLDITKLEEHLNDLKQYDTEYFNKFPVNPLLCLDTVYYYLKFGIIKKEAMVELTRFYFNPPAVAGKKNSKFMEVIYLLATSTLAICQNPRKTLRFIKVIDKIYPKGSAGFNFLMKIGSAEAHLALGNNYEALTIFSDLSAVYPHDETGYTSIMKVCYYSLKLKLTIYNNQEAALFEEIRNLVTLCDDSAFKLVKVRSLAFALANYALLKQDSQIFNQLYFDFIKTARTSGCVTENFMRSQAIMDKKI